MTNEQTDQQDNPSYNLRLPHVFEEGISSFLT
jgi:hypothetical protein